MKIMETDRQRETEFKEWDQKEMKRILQTKNERNTIDAKR